MIGVPFEVSNQAVLVQAPEVTPGTVIWNSVQWYMVLEHMGDDTISSLLLPTEAALVGQVPWFVCNWSHLEDTTNTGNVFVYRPSKINASSR